jgi:hypothetical protein
MSAPITPVPPVNAAITIQPVASAITGGNVAGAQTLLALLSDGTLVSGFVVNRDAQNNPIIRTGAGDFVIKSDVFVKTGSDVVLRVNASLPSQAHIVSIDHLTPEAYSAQNTRITAEDSIAQSQFKALAQAMQTPASQTGLNTYPVLRAVLLQLFPNATSTPAAIPVAGTTPNVPPSPPILAAATAGTNLNITIYDVKLPLVPVAVNTLPAAAHLANLLPTPPVTETVTGQPALPLTPPVLPSTLAAPLATAFMAFEPKTIGQPVQVSAPVVPTLPADLPAPTPAAPSLPPALNATSSTTIPSNTTPPLPASAQQPALPTNVGPIYQGTVIGHGEDGASIVHTAFASLKLYAAQPLPTGTTLAITVQPAPAAGTDPAFAPALQAPSALPLRMDFSYLAPALSQLVQDDPAIAREVMQHLPVMGPRFTSGLLFFLSAVKSGERRGIFNSSEISRLEAVVPGLLAQLNKDIRELHQAFIAPRFEEWKPVHLPLIFGTNVETAQLYIRQDAPESGAKIEKSAGGQRFLLDIHLSELGNLQLDGFIREGERNKSLELFLRSAAPLDPSISQHIRTLFADATQTAGMAGNIVFQQGVEHFVKPQPASPPRKGNDLSHTILA